MLKELHTYSSTEALTLEEYRLLMEIALLTTHWYDANTSEVEFSVDNGGSRYWVEGIQSKEGDTFTFLYKVTKPNFKHIFWIYPKNSENGCSIKLMAQTLQDGLALIDNYLRQLYIKEK